MPQGRRARGGHHPREERAQAPLVGPRRGTRRRRRRHRQLLPRRDGKIEAIEDGTPESQWVAEQLGRPVVKAFNNIYSEHLANEGRPSGTPGRIALPIAGDDPGDKAVVARLIDELGFDAIDAGTLEESWRQQPGTRSTGPTTTRRACGSPSPQPAPSAPGLPGLTGPRPANSRPRGAGFGFGHMATLWAVAS